MPSQLDANQKVLLDQLERHWYENDGSGMDAEELREATGFYKSAIPDVHMALSQPCNRFFHEDDFEYAVLKEGKCPYSRAKEVGDFGTV